MIALQADAIFWTILLGAVLGVGNMKTFFKL